MKIPPSLTEEFDSPLVPSELLARVQHNTSNRVLEWQNEAFRGEVGTTSFAIKRVRWFNNISNRPNITGWVEALPEGRGSKLRLRHYLGPFGFWVSAVIIFLICAFGLLMAVDSVLNDDTSPLVLLLPPSLFSLGLFSVTGPFWQEVRSSREFLIKLLALEKQRVS